MSPLRRLVSAKAALVLLPVLVALLVVRLFALPGFMPDRAQDGSITLAICAPTGTSPAILEIPIDRQGDAQGSGEAQHCDFAAGAQFADLGSAPALGEFPASAGHDAGALPAGDHPALHRALPPATGPPVFTA